MRTTGFLLGMLLCGTTLFGQQKDWAGFDRYREANRTAKQGAEAVFMGNSITEGWARMRPGFFADNGYIGRGISGQTSAEMLARFRPDVIELAPKAVVILAGTNDIAQNNGPIELENVMDNIASMCELARLHNIRVLLCSVLPAAAFPWREGIKPADSIIRLNAMIEAYARENGIEYVDYHSRMKDGRNGLPPEYSKDGVHPNPEGYRVMEGIIASYLK